MTDDTRRELAGAVKRRIFAVARFNQGRVCLMISLPAWSLPLLLTVALWAWGILAPIEPARGDYDFGPALKGAARLAGCVIGTLIFWLVFFMAKSGGLA